MYEAKMPFIHHVYELFVPELSKVDKLLFPKNKQTKKGHHTLLKYTS